MLIGQNNPLLPSLIECVCVWLDTANKSEEVRIHILMNYLGSILMRDQRDQRFQCLIHRFFFRIHNQS